MDTSEGLTRRVHLRAPGGETEVDVTVSWPRRDPARRDPHCLVLFPGIMGNAIRVSGVDEMAAMNNALGLLRDLVAEHKTIGWEVWWLAKGDDGAF